MSEYKADNVEINLTATHKPTEINRIRQHLRQYQLKTIVEKGKQDTFRILQLQVWLGLVKDHTH